VAQAKKGDRVQIAFTGKLEDGTIFDSTNPEGGECGCDDCDCEEGPMELVIGEGEFFAGIEDALVGMAAGEKKTVVIPAGEAFGEYDEEIVFTIDRDQLPADISPEVGQELELTDEEDQVFVMTVAEVNDHGVVLDANHPLAGENLIFELELVAIQ